MYAIRNWDKFQHYKDRNPPWIKLHFELLSSPDWVALADADRVLAIACMLIASRHDGKIPDDPVYIARVAYLNSPPNFKTLIKCGFLVHIASAPQAFVSTLQADASTMHTNARPETETETETETEGSSLRSEPPRARASASRATRLNSNFVIPGQWIAEAGAERDRCQLPRANIEAEAVAFIGHACGNARESFDWKRSFIQWCMKAQPETKPNGTGQDRSGPATKIFEGAARVLAKREAQRQTDPRTDFDPTVPLLDSK